MKRYQYTLLKSDLNELESDLNRMGEKGGRLINSWPDPDTGKTISIIVQEMDSGAQSDQAMQAKPAARPDKTPVVSQLTSPICLADIRKAIEGTRHDGARLDFLASFLRVTEDQLKSRLEELGLTYENGRATEQSFPDGYWLTVNLDKNNSLWVNLKQPKKK